MPSTGPVRIERMDFKYKEIKFQPIFTEWKYASYLVFLELDAINSFRSETIFTAKIWESFRIEEVSALNSIFIRNTICLGGQDLSRCFTTSSLNPLFFEKM